MRIDLAGRTVTSATPEKATVTPYDSLIVAAGSAQSYFGHDDFAEHAPGMKTIDDALALRGRLFGAFELAELESDPAVIERWQTFVVIGGGPTGVEIAGQIAELARRSLPGEFRNIDPARSRIILFEAGPEVLPGFGERLSDKAARELRRVACSYGRAPRSSAWTRPASTSKRTASDLASRPCPRSGRPEWPPHPSAPSWPRNDSSHGSAHPATSHTNDRPR
jgi:hypothetical protein